MCAFAFSLELQLLESESASRSVQFLPHKFNVISLCGVNGHLALGVMFAASHILNAS